MLRTAAVLLSLVSFVLTVDIQFVSTISDYKLQCTYEKRQSTVSAGYVVGLIDIDQTSDNWRLGRINLDTGAISVLGNSSFEFLIYGGVAIDPINQRVFVLRSTAETQSVLQTYSLITGAMLYNVNVNGNLKYLSFDPTNGTLYCMKWVTAESQEYVLSVDYTTGVATVRGKPDSSYVQNFNRCIDPVGKSFYYTGADSAFNNFLYKVNLTTGVVSKQPIKSNGVSLTFDPYGNPTQVLSFSQTDMNSTALAPATIEIATGKLSAISSLRYDSLIVNDRAYDLYTKTIIGPMDNSSVVSVVDMQKGTIVKNIEFPSHYRFGPIAFQQFCTCCVSSQPTARKVLADSVIDNSLVLPCKRSATSVVSVSAIVLAIAIVSHF